MRGRKDRRTIGIQPAILPYVYSTPPQSGRWKR
ncbi:Uncharacterised protein [Bordetella pertussis]|nr:Uncharacterised protein [Bordetella pertussis]CFP65472.1 Uncharacterised protein [Bordetella pertussis]